MRTLLGSFKTYFESAEADDADSDDLKLLLRLPGTNRFENAIADYVKNSWDVYGEDDLAPNLIKVLKSVIDDGPDSGIDQELIDGAKTLLPKYVNALMAQGRNDVFVDLL
jgi:hypothetical protein